MKLHNQPTINNSGIASVEFNDYSLLSYLDFIQIRGLPTYKVTDNRVDFPANYIDGYYEHKTKLPLEITPALFDYQQVVAKVAFIKQNYGIFMDMGLGKTLVGGELIRQVHAVAPDKKLLYVTALNILDQSLEMCQSFFADFPAAVNLHKSKMTLKEWCILGDEPVAFVNHEAFLKVDELPRNVELVFLDEASILKGGIGGNGKIAKNLIAACKHVPRRIAASGTPAPNDKTEYAMIAWFLGKVNSEKEFYSMYFVNKDGEYQLRRFAVEAFYRYLASWSIFIRRPSSYGFEDNLKGLKKWKEIHEIVPITQAQQDAIARYARKGKQPLLPGVPVPPTDMSQRSKFSQISKGFIYNGNETEYVESSKPDRITGICNRHKGKQILIWAVFDEEGDILERNLSQSGYRVAHITGKTSIDNRLRLIEDFRHGEIDVLISKPRILGFGLNFQFCHIEIFSGLQDSFEQYIQAVKRVHRYGQTEQVLIYLVYTPYEEVIIQNVLKKQKSMEQDFAYQEKLYINSLADELKDFLLLEDYSTMAVEEAIQYEPIKTSDYQLYHGDSIKMMLEIRDGKEYGWLKPNSVDLSVFSPPFPGDVFTYSRNPADMGNTRGAGAIGGMDDFMLQFQFFLEGMRIVTKPGRIMAMHLEDIPYRKGLDGFVGIYDVVGEAIRQATKAGWILIAKIPIVKNQQMQAIMKKISSLTMSNMETDRLRIAPANNGYLCLFKKPGEANIQVADLAKCNDCGWEGYAHDLLGWQPKRGYRSQFLLDVIGQCPKCESGDILSYSEMDGNKWIICAEGVWPDGTQFDDFDKMSKISRDQRWYENVFQTALGTWFDVHEPDVLRLPFNGHDDEDSDKHLCPLPLTVLQRPIEMYSLPGETVFTPFSGSGTCLDRAIRLGRKVVGIELKPEYFVLSESNASKAIQERHQMTLFDLDALKIAA